MKTITPQRARTSDGGYKHNLLVYDDHGLKNTTLHDSITFHCVDETASMKLENALKELTVDFED